MSHFLCCSFVFPRFLDTVKSAGGAPEVVIRLTTFHDLNVSRMSRLTRSLRDMELTTWSVFHYDNDAIGYPRNLPVHLLRTASDSGYRWG